MKPSTAAQLHQLLFFVGGVLAFFSIDRQVLSPGLAIIIISFGPGCTLFASRSLEMANRYLTVSLIALAVLTGYLLLTGASFFDAIALRSADGRDVKVGMAISYGYCLAGTIFRLLALLKLFTPNCDVDQADEFECADDVFFKKTLRFRIWLASILGILVILLLLWD